MMNGQPEDPVASGKRRSAGGRFFLALLALLALVAPGAHGKGKTHHVSIVGYKYRPAHLQVSVGDAVAWTNRDEDPHSVTSFTPRRVGTLRDLELEKKHPDDRFDSGDFGRNQRFRHTFTSPGPYYYYCPSHPLMVGKIAVIARPSSR